MKDKHHKELEAWEAIRANQGQSSEQETATAKIWAATQHYSSAREPDVEAALRRLHERMPAQQTTPLRRRQFIRTVAGLAAALALAFGIMAALRHYTQDAADGQTADSTMFIRTAAGEQRDVVLPDGSNVYLNENSTLEYSTQLHTLDTRTVSLSGEAFFNVKRNPEQPFVVQVPMGKVQVLGTSFNVYASTSDAVTSVEVSTGKVSLENLTGDQKVVLLPNQTGTLSSAGDIVVNAAPQLNQKAWHTGKMVFVDAPVTEVLALLEKQYHVQFDLSEARLNADCTISANWQNQNLEQCLANLSNLTALRFYRQNNGRYAVNGKC